MKRTVSHSSLFSPAISPSLSILLRDLDEHEKNITNLKNQLQIKKQEPKISNKDIVARLHSDFVVGHPEKEKIEPLDNTKPESECDPTILLQLTGITFTKNKNRLVVYDNVFVRLYELKGACYGLHFLVNFSVLEEEKKISSITIKLQPEIYALTKTFVYRVGSHVGLYQFFSSFSQFAEAFNERKKLFQSMKTKYPESVTIPNSHFGEWAHIKPHGKPLHFIFIWKISINENGKVVQQTKINPKTIRNLTVGDKKAVVLALPYYFSELVNHKGIQSAVDIIVRIASQDVDIDEIEIED